MSLDKKVWAPKEIPEDQYKKVKAEVEEKIVVARIGLLLRNPFFGNIATRLGVKNADGWCSTAATDGRNLYYSTPFFNELTNKQIEYVIAHEILHCIFNHIVRREHREPELYNVACDYIVNNVLVRDKIGEKVTQFKIYQDFKYAKWSSEEIYDHLLKQNEKIDDDLQSMLSELGQMLDDHVDWENSSDDGDGDGNSKPVYTKKELREIQDEIKEAVVAAHQSSGAGNTPKEVERIIRELTEPKIDWREVLQQQIQSTIKHDFSFARPSRKSWQSGAILPGQTDQETIDISIALDMSGSISNHQARDFLSEVQGIMDEYTDYAIKVWCFDTQVYNKDEFTGDDGRDILEYSIKGGGGTSFECNWTYMKNEDIVPKKLLMFTDGGVWGSWGDPDYCDTVFIIHSNPSKSIKSPFGLTVHYE